MVKRRNPKANRRWRRLGTIFKQYGGPSHREQESALQAITDPYQATSVPKAGRAVSETYVTDDLDDFIAEQGPEFHEALAEREAVMDLAMSQADDVLLGMNVKQLRGLCQDRRIPKNRVMTKAQMIEALRGVA